MIFWLTSIETAYNRVEPRWLFFCMHGSNCKTAVENIHSHGSGAKPCAAHSTRSRPVRSRIHGQPTRKPLTLLFPVILLLAGCDGGLAPPPPSPLAVIEGTVYYNGPWPHPDSVRELRFVAMRFVPQSALDLLLRFNEIEYSDTLRRFVDSDTFRVVIDLEGVAADTFRYSGIAWKFGPGLLDWRPLVVYDRPLILRPGERRPIVLEADFRNPARFPGSP
ncbi:hypothetical protein Rmar_1096 [Rhodothermus marinus DSM 4252]|uniref:Uncharacterized protein n=1 Tax=Rhodothermus marinus (strain ATCC 43812 / DSM 4252 / R-10) TaxID=518766 RepID=D0MHM9_RHOM4|nr:hypothetical protein Rmar_1096 [Rhodothermus marinus DSM 4252]